MGRPALSVVIPSLDEAAGLGALIDGLDAQEGIELETILSDGGSVDGTAALARQRGLTVVEGPPGRGRQLNAGRARARAPWLLFLHADSRLGPPDQLAAALAFARTVLGPRDAGHFALRFVDAAAHGLDLGFYEAKSALGRPETTHGDQGLLIRAATFDALGGYPTALPFLEDQGLGQRLHAAGGRYHRLPGWLGTSARRFSAEGVRARSIQNAVIMALFHTGHTALLADLPALYAVQSRTGRRSTRAFFAALETGIAALPPAAQARVWAGLGRALRSLGPWQLFFALDHLQQGPAAAHHHPWLDRWEGGWAAAVDRPGVDALAQRLARATVGLAGRLA